MTKTYDNNDGIYNEVVLIDENGKEITFDHLLTFLYEKEKYVALLPLDEVEGLDEDDVLLMHIITKDGEDTYETIDNEILLNEVFEEFMRIIDEMDEEEEE